MRERERARERERHTDRQRERERERCLWNSSVDGSGGECVREREVAGVREAGCVRQGEVGCGGQREARGA